MNKKLIITGIVSSVITAIVVYASTAVIGTPELPSMAGITDYLQISVNDGVRQSGTDSTARAIVVDPLKGAGHPDGAMAITAADLNAKFVALQFQHDKLICETLETGYYDESTQGCESATQCSDYSNPKSCTEDLSVLGNCEWNQGTETCDLIVATVLGCTNPAADNHDPAANSDDGSCILSGCTDVAANNYDASANNDDGSCTYDPTFTSVVVKDSDTNATITTIEEGDSFYVEATLSGAVGDCAIWNSSNNPLTSTDVSGTNYSSGDVVSAQSDAPYSVICDFNAATQNVSQAVNLTVIQSQSPILDENTLRTHLFGFTGNLTPIGDIYPTAVNYTGGFNSITSSTQAILTSPIAVNPAQAHSSTTINAITGIMWINGNQCQWQGRQANNSITRGIIMTSAYANLTQQDCADVAAYLYNKTPVFGTEFIESTVSFIPLQ